MRGTAVTCTVVMIALVCATAFGGYVDTTSQKADRGFSNVLGCWLEIPYHTYGTSKERGVWSGAPIGLCKGILFTPLRLVSGAVDIVTIPVAFPNDWKGLMSPEYNPWVEQHEVVAQPEKAAQPEKTGRPEKVEPEQGG